MSNSHKSLNRHIRQTALAIITIICLLVVIPAGCTCNCSPDNSGIGGDWNPRGIGVRDYDIIYQTKDGDEYQLWVMNSDSSQPTMIADNIIPGRTLDLPDGSNTHSTPFGGTAWSPDGLKIVYVAGTPSGNPELMTSDMYVVNADGTGSTRLTSYGWATGMPSWSPDGNRIAFAFIDLLGPGYSFTDIYVIDADGGNQERLTYFGSGFMSVCEPQWCPADDKILFTWGSALYIMDTDGSNHTRLTYFLEVSGKACNPQWSPDGTKIAFYAQALSDSIPQWDLYIMNADGTGQTNITNNTDLEPYFVWSPDSSKIAFSSYDYWHNDRWQDIYVVDSDGSNLVNLTNTQYDDEYPQCWSPDGLKIFYYYQTGIDDAVSYVMNADGSNKTKLVNGIGVVCSS